MPKNYVKKWWQSLTLFWRERARKNTLNLKKLATVCVCYCKPKILLQLLLDL